MRFWSLLFVSALFAVQSIYAEKTPSSPPPMSVSLKPRQPNWRLDIVESYQTGQPKQVVFYEPKVSGQEIPVKQIFYHEQGSAASESDVIEIAKDDPAYAIWNSTIVPHGPKVDFSPKGTVSKVFQFNRGFLHGECRTFYPNGETEAIVHYSNGQLEGLAEVYYDNGQKKEEARYINGKLSGECTQYYSNGMRSALIVYADGLIQGTAIGMVFERSS